MVIMTDSNDEIVTTNIAECHEVHHVGAGREPCQRMKDSLQELHQKLRRHYSCQRARHNRQVFTLAETGTKVSQCPAEHPR